jgi:hypothetical protein
MEGDVCQYSERFPPAYENTSVDWGSPTPVSMGLGEVNVHQGGAARFYSTVASESVKKWNFADLGEDGLGRVGQISKLYLLTKRSPTPMRPGRSPEPEIPQCRLSEQILCPRGAVARTTRRSSIRAV